ncbi:MAG: hypothetical protein PHH13_04725 [Candidatus Peribacteraceae bacterium]|nr:hypothetical protein [Candidatus Peribacteraceae bacterium]
MTGGSEYVGSRFGATLALMGNDMKEGIEGKDPIDDTIHGVRNAFVALWHGLQGIIPSAANAMSDQQFRVTHRSGTLHGTANSAKKVIETKGLLGKASAVLAEATDGPVDDFIDATTGGTQWIVEPVKGIRMRTAATFQNAA